MMTPPDAYKNEMQTVTHLVQTLVDNIQPNLEALVKHGWQQSLEYLEICQKHLNSGMTILRDYVSHEIDANIDNYPYFAQMQKHLALYEQQIDDVLVRYGTANEKNLNEKIKKLNATKERIENLYDKYVNTGIIR